VLETFFNLHYLKFQDECISLAEEIKRDFRSDDHPDWQPLIFQTDGLQRTDLVAHYMAMDVGVVTPRKDGMNLVAKEMMVCNPMAGLVLSTGAGSEIQFTMAGLHPDDGDFTYHRVDDLADVEVISFKISQNFNCPTLTALRRRTLRSCH
jgi:hypothetical protein